MVNTALSTLLITSMENREQTLLNNSAFICAMFLDGRVNSVLSGDQQETAKSRLLELHRHLINLNNNKENEPHSSSSSGSLPKTNANDNSARKELENFLSVKYVEAQSDIHVLLQRRMNVPVSIKSPV
ncbi:unnamed protein product [Colias eurytheme]|nr:unnamed protein product [Colias eurytheme]